MIDWRFVTRRLGLDIGDKRIGVAISDTNGILASPFTIIERKGERQDIGAILSIIIQNEVERIVVGLPRSLNGSIGGQAEKVMAFIKKLSSQTDIPVEFRDERLTTVSAKRLMQAVKNRKSKRRTRDDAIAAALILQGYLDESQNG